MSLKTYRISKTKAGNMPVGTRFMMGSHSSLMIATNLKREENGKKQRLVVSENGLTEWVDIDAEFPRYHSEVTSQFSALSSIIIKNQIDDVHKLMNEELNLGTKISHPKIITILGTKTWEILIHYIEQELQGAYPPKTENVRDLSVAWLKRYIDFERLRKYRNFGKISEMKIKKIFEEAKDYVITSI